MKRHLVVLGLLVATAGLTFAQAKKDQAEAGEAVPEGRVRVALDPGMHVAPIWGVFFRDGGRQVVTAGGDQTVRLWEPEGKGLRLVKVIHPPGHGGLAWPAVSSDGDRLAVSTMATEKGVPTCVVHVLTLPEGHLVKTIRVIGERALPLGVFCSFSPDRKRLAVSSWNQPIRVYDLTKDVAPVTIKKPVPFNSGAVAFSPDGQLLAWCKAGPVWENGALFDTRSGEKVADLDGSLVAWAPDGKTLATVSPKGAAFYDRDGKRLHFIEDKVNYANVNSVAISPDGQSVLRNGVVKFARTADKPQRFPLREPHGGTASARGPYTDYSPDGLRFVRATVNSAGSNWIQILDAGTGEVLQQMISPGMFAGLGSVEGVVRWSRDGQAVCWRNAGITTTKNPTQLQDPTLQQATFRLDKLELAPTLKADESGPGLVQKRGDLSLEMPDPKNLSKWDLLRGGKVIASLHEAAGERGVFRPTLLAGDRVAATTHQIVLFDNRGQLLRRLATGYRDTFSPVAPSPSPDKEGGRYLATYRRAGGLYIWSPEQEHPLLSLYRSGPDWVVWTHEGYYAATPGGEKMVSWKIDNGIDKMPTVLTVDRFGQKFRRPDVIKKAFELGSVKAALEALDGKGAKVATVEETLPPVATVKVLKQDKGEVTLEVTARAQAKGQPVAALRLMLDGRPLPDPETVRKYSPAEAEPKPWVTTLRVPEGRHTVGALVRSADAFARAEAVSVEWVAEANKPVLHVVAVGVDKYAPGIGDLKCAVQDATDIEAAFARVKGDKAGLFRDVRTHLVTGAGATSGGVRVALERLATGPANDRAGRSDVVVVFLAGHGTLSRGDFFYLTADSPADPKELGEKNALSGKALAGSLGRLGCRVLLLLDACHSGAADLRPASDDAARALSDDDVGVTVMAAAMGKQKAEEKNGNGLFTLAVKEALAGPQEVGRARDGRLFVHHLNAYVADRVAELSDGRQNPFLRLPDGVQPFPLRQLEAKK